MDTNWYNNLNTPDDLKRLTSAQKSECAPLSLDKEKQVGSFTGKHGSYTASMYECTCVDFMRRKLPCKHMIRLAIELGYIKINVEQGSKRARKSTSGFTLEELVARVESLSEEAQRLYFSFLLEFIYRKRNNVLVDNDDTICNLVNAGLVQVVRNDCDLLESLTGKEIMERLRSAGLAPSKRPRTNADLVNWCLSNLQDIPNIFPDLSLITATDDTLRSCRKTYTYLRRKFEDEGFFNESSNQIEYFPAGAHYDGVTWSFPDDEVTALLNQYGCNRCKSI